MSVARSKRVETGAVKACEKRILEFPMEMGAREVAKQGRTTTRLLQQRRQTGSFVSGRTRQARDKRRRRSCRSMEALGLDRYGQTREILVCGIDPLRPAGESKRNHVAERRRPERIVFPNLTGPSAASLPAIGLHSAQRSNFPNAPPRNSLGAP